MTPLIVTVISLSIIFASTTLGSSLVFLFRNKYGPRTSSIIMGLASGIMISTSFFGLILPSIEESSKIYGENLDWMPPLVGFILGAIFLFLLDKIVPHLHKNDNNETEEGLKNKFKDETKFFLAVLIHNIPEGIAVGLACGLALHTGDSVHMMGALSLAIGIAIQNFPEGSAVSIPLFGEGVSKTKSFLLGSLSGIVEPLFGILAIFLAQFLTGATPFLLSFAAGAMIYVTIDELIPEFKNSNFDHYGLWAFVIGFSIMMLLEMII